MNSLRVISALVLRYIFLYTRHPVRFVELIFWPIVDLMVWGFLMTYLQKNAGSDFPVPLTFLLGGMILWDVLFRSQQGVAISFLEDVWTHNLLNIFVAPVRTTEYVAATCLVGVLRVGFTLLILGVIASLAYGFNILTLWPSLLPFLGALMLFGWSLGMVSTALIMRWGQAAEGLAWAVPFFIQPLAAVFYPLDALPLWMQTVAEALPAAHIFEGMRQVLVTGNIPWHHLQRAFLLDGIWFLLAALFYALTLAHVRRSGLLVKVATH